MSHHKAPHREWSPDAKHAALFADQTIPEPATFNDDYATRSDAARTAIMRIDRDLTRNDLKLTPPPGLRGTNLIAWRRGTDMELEVVENGQTNRLIGAALKKWKYQRYMKDYLACVASVDTNVGRLLDYLDETGLATNTIVIYTSDQGFFLGEHGWFDKRFMYEESIRMPFLVRYPPAIKPGSVSEAMVLNVDFAPTFLEFAGLNIPAGNSRSQFETVAHGADAKRLAHELVLSLLPFPERTRHRAALRRAHRTPQTDLFPSHQSVGTVRSPNRPAGSEQSCQRSETRRPGRRIEDRTHPPAQGVG
jgi:arylsulfatase A-like enzyme